jgi:hypothetical protein
VWPAVADYHALKGDGCAFVAVIGGECTALVWAGDGISSCALYLVGGGSIRVVLDMEEYFWFMFFLPLFLANDWRLDALCCFSEDGQEGCWFVSSRFQSEVEGCHASALIGWIGAEGVDPVAHAHDGAC